MTDDLRTRIAAAIQSIRIQRAGDAGEMADAVIRELEANCIYRYACAHCGDFWFDESERMQRFALLHGKAHTDARRATGSRSRSSRSAQRHASPTTPSTH